MARYLTITKSSLTTGNGGVTHGSAMSFKYTLTTKRQLVHENGSRGGFVESPYNLSQEGWCWVYEGARVMEDARVSDNAMIHDNATICGSASVSGSSFINDSSKVCGNALLTGHTILLEHVVAYGRSVFRGGVVRGTIKIGGHMMIVGGEWSGTDNMNAADYHILLDHAG